MPPVLLVLAVVGLAGGAAQSFLKNQPPRITVEARAAAPLARAGQPITVEVTSRPVRGIHVYAPGNPNYIPVTVSVTPIDGIVVGEPKFPKAETYFFAPLKESVQAYSSPFTVAIPVTATAAFFKSRAPDSPASVKLAGLVRYQACDDRVCFPPQTAAFAVDVPVGAARR